MDVSRHPRRRSCRKSKFEKNNPSKILEVIIQEKLQSKVEDILRDEQAEFRPNRSCVRIIIEQAIEWRTPL